MSALKSEQLLVFSELIYLWKSACSSLILSYYYSPIWTGVKYELVDTVTVSTNLHYGYELSS
jgi:hypothetical protein